MLHSIPQNPQKVKKIVRPENKLIPAKELLLFSNRENSQWYQLLWIIVLSSSYLSSLNSA